MLDRGRIVGPPPGYGQGPGFYGSPPAGGPGSGCGVAGLLIGLAVGVLVLVMLGGFAAFFLRARRGPGPAPVTWSGPGPAPTVVSPAPTASFQWEGVHGAILTDVNGDGVLDVVGRLRYVPGGDQVTLAAFEGAAGTRLWESAAIGSYTDTYQGLMGLAEGTLVLCQASGDTAGWSVKDGTKRWSGTLPEKAKRLCRGDHPGEVRALLADGSAVAVHLADGHTTVLPMPASHAGPCARIATDKERDGDPDVEVRDVMGDGPKIDGMQARITLQRATGPEIVLGHRAKGTAVPMIAGVFTDPSHDWKSELPSSRPLEAMMEPWPTSALTSTRVFTEYRAGGGVAQTLVAFDLGGARLWEAPMPDNMPLSSLGADAERLYVSQWTHLTVLDAASGKTRYTIGHM